MYAFTRHCMLELCHCLVRYMMFCGAQAPGMCLQEVEVYVSKIKAAGGHATVHVYPGEGHAFMNSEPDSFKRMDSKLRHIMLFSVAYCLNHSTVACQPVNVTEQPSLSPYQESLCLLPAPHPLLMISLTLIRGRLN